MRNGMDLPRAAAMAYRCLLTLPKLELPVQPLDFLRRCRDTRVMSVDEAAELLPDASLRRMAELADAWTYCQSQPDGTARYLVVFAAGGNRARLRFSLAHELGHRVLGHTGAYAWEEREADVFASHLLCPRPAIEGRAPAEAAKLCYVSLTCAEYALRAPRIPVDAALERELRAKMQSEHSIEIQG